jgi:polar amino acid transport system substrate-binding protein
MTNQLLVIISLFAASASFATGADKASYPPVRFYVANFPPYAFINPVTPTGFFVDIIKAMAKHADHNGSLDIVPWKRAQRELLELKDKSPKLIFPLIRSTDRESQYRWIAEVFTDDLVLIVRNSEKRDIKNLSDAVGLKIGVVGGSALLTELQQDGKHQIDVAPDIESCAKKLNLGRIDAWYVSRWVGVSTFKHIGMDAKNFRVSPAFHRMPISLAASLDTPDEVIKLWEKAFKAIKASGEYDTILKKWKESTGDS